MRIFIDGANGRVGRMLIHQMFKKGLQPILLGRNSQAVLDMACHYQSEAILLPSYGLPKHQLQKSDVLINCSTASRKDRHKSLELCLLTGAHYLDLSCEHLLMKKFLSSKNRKQIEESKSVCILGLGIGSLLSDYVASHLVSEQNNIVYLRLIWQLFSAAPFPSLLDVMVKAYLLSCGPRSIGSFFKKNQKEKRSLLMRRQEKSILGISLPLGVDLLIKARTSISRVQTYALIDHQFISRLRTFEKVSAFLPQKIVKSWVSNFLTRGKLSHESSFRKAPFCILAEAQWSDGRKESFELCVDTPSSLMIALVIDLCNELSKKPHKPGIYSPIQFLGHNILDRISGVSLSKKDTNLIDFA